MILIEIELTTATGIKRPIEPDSCLNSNQAEISSAMAIL
jgi:hypothetical protein